MLISLCTHHEGKFSQSIDTIFVPLLQTWISNPQSSKNLINPMKPSLEEILNDPELLYMFMQHIKDSGLVTLLQFCLDIGKFQCTCTKCSEFLINYKLIKR